MKGEMVLKKFFYLTLCMFLFFCNSSLLNGAGLSFMLDPTQGETFLPEGQDVVVMYFDVFSDEENVRLTNVSISNLGESLTQVGTKPYEGIGFDASYFDRISIYEDVDSDSQFNKLSDTLLDSAQTIVGTDFNFQFSSSIISSKNVQTTSTGGRRFFIVYSVKEVTPLTQNNDAKLIQTNLRLNKLISNQGFELNFADISDRRYTFTGIKVTETESFTNDLSQVVFPDSSSVNDLEAERFPLLYFSFQPLNNSIGNVKLKIQNTYNNFDVDNTLDGIVKVELVKNAFPGNPNFDLNDNVIVAEKIFSSSDFSSEFVSFDIPGTFQDSEEHSYWVVYSIGENMSVSTNSKVSCRLVELSGLQNSSSLSMSFSSSNVIIQEAFVGGLTIQQMKTEVNNLDKYGENDLVNMLSFTLRSHQTSSNITNITLINDSDSTDSIISSSTIPYCVSGGLRNCIQKIYLYEDNGNEFFSELEDFLITSVNLLNSIQGNTRTQATLVMDNLQLESYTENIFNEKFFFVFYQISTSVEFSADGSTNQASAAMGTIRGYLDYVSRDLEVVNQLQLKISNTSNDLPLNSNPVSTVTLADTNISKITFFKPTNFFSTPYEGQIKVPVMGLEFFSDNLYPSLFFNFYNERSNFSEDSLGIKKVWLYRDSNLNKQLDNSDELLSSTTEFKSLSEGVLGSFSDSDVTIGNIEVKSGANALILAVSIGQEASRNNEGMFNFQLRSIESDQNTSLAVGGALSTPIPQIAVTINAQPAILKSNNILLTRSSFFEATTTFNLRYEVTNSISDKNLSDVQVIPKVYLNALNGLDISYEFSVQALNEHSTSILQGNPQLYEFQMSHFEPFSNGKGFVDVLLEYKIDTIPGDADSGYTIQYERYLDSEWSPGAVSNFNAIDLVSDFVANETPPYIVLPLHLNEQRSIPFFNGSAVKAGDEIYITLRDKDAIDEGSISVVQNGNTLSRQTQLATGAYKYDQSTGVISFQVGSTSSEVLIDVKDNNNVSYPQSKISYTIEENKVSLTSPLFYPNPYIMGNSSLKLGFSLSRVSKIDIYVYNHFGSEVFKQSLLSSQTNVGFNFYEFPNTSQFIVPGIFISRIIATDLDGNKSTGTTRLAIY